MGFSRFLTKAKAQGTKFFGTTLPTWKKNAQEGVRFFNTHIAPAAKSIHGAVKNVHESVQADDKLSGKIKKKVDAVAKFADVGLQHLEHAGGYANKAVAGL